MGGSGNFISHGIDIVEISRIEQMVDRHGYDGLSRIFTAKEIDYARQFKKNPAERLAGRYAVKEAVLKALGTGLRDGINMNDIETINDDLGKPVVSLSGKAKEKAEEIEIKGFDVSISHAGGIAMASCIAFR